VRNREESRVKHPSNRFHAPVPVNYDATDDGVEQEAEVTTIFAHDDWDYDVEKRSRSREAPYIIHAEEMFNKEEPFEDFSESTITWFDGDNVLVDENEVPIYNPDQVVGKLNFGHGSGDKNVCYVRNESLEHDYEVLLDTGTYEAAVAGLRAEKEIEDDLQHSEPLRMRRMRDY